MRSILRNGRPARNRGQWLLALVTSEIRNRTLQEIQRGIQWLMPIMVWTAMR
ncbi:MAG: hypothetical protein QOC94_1977, partial [Actinoplanes sp.]|nr:hypothetical protein [Actinoplanes sp.]